MIPWLTIAIALPVIGAAVIWALPRVKTTQAAASTGASASAATPAQAGAATATATRAPAGTDRKSTRLNSSH